MSRSYRFSPESGVHNTGGKRQSDRRHTRRDRRLIQQLAEIADAFVPPLSTEPLPRLAGGFGSERHFSNPAKLARRF